MNIILYEQTCFMHAVYSLVNKIDKVIPREYKVKAYISGGVAVHVYTGSRVSDDIDVVFSHKIILPQGLVMNYADEASRTKSLHLDYGFNPAFSLVHPDFREDAILLKNTLHHTIELYVISTVDLVISKLVRLNDTDIADIKALCELKVFTADELESRANSALESYVGNKSRLEQQVKAILQYII